MTTTDSQSQDNGLPSRPVPPLNEGAETLTLLQEMVLKIVGCSEGNGFSKVEIANIYKLIATAERAAIKKNLERLKQYNGAYIGMDGKRVNNMVSHSIIDELLAELSGEETTDNG